MKEELVGYSISYLAVWPHVYDCNYIGLSESNQMFGFACNLTEITSEPVVFPSTSAINCLHQTLSTKYNYGRSTITATVHGRRLERWGRGGR